MKFLKSLPFAIALCSAAALVPATAPAALAQVTNIDVQWATSSIMMAGKRPARGQAPLASRVSMALRIKPEWRTATVAIARTSPLSRASRPDSARVRSSVSSRGRARRRTSSIIVAAKSRVRCPSSVASLTKCSPEWLPGPACVRASTRSRPAVLD